jgi:hypothetical protein
MITPELAIALTVVSIMTVFERLILRRMMAGENVQSRI